MKTLDLHGLRHKDAQRKTEKFVNDNWSTIDGGLKIITGNSSTMKKVVTDVLDQYDLGYTIGGPLGIDGSYILTQ